MNPIKVGMVKDIAGYEWSSYRYNALGQPDILITGHKLYEDLGSSTELRCERYSEILASFIFPIK